MRSLLETAVHIWRIPLAAAPAALECYQRILNAEERAQAARFHFQIHRTRFIISRARVRIVLASYLDCAPAALTFRQTSYGKPYLPDSSVAFNLSHSHEMAALGVTRNRPIGVDIEFIRSGIELENIAELYFAAAEVRALRSLPPEQRLAAFFRCWTRKEAYIKARGEGLSMPLGDFEVCMEERDELPLTNYKDARERMRWEMRNIPFWDGYVSAAVVEGHHLDFEYFDWDEAAETR